MLIGQEINLKNVKKKQTIIFFSKKEEKQLFQQPEELKENI